MNKMIRSLFYGMSFALGVQTIHADITFTLPSKAKMEANMRSATRFDHAITAGSALAVLHGLSTGNALQVITWLIPCLYSGFGTVLNDKRIKKIARFSSAGALVSHRMFGLYPIQGQRVKKRRTFYHTEEAEFVGAVAGIAAFYFDEGLDNFRAGLI